MLVILNAHRNPTGQLKHDARIGAQHGTSGQQKEHLKIAARTDCFFSWACERPEASLEFEFQCRVAISIQRCL